MTVNYSKPSSGILPVYSSSPPAFTGDTAASTFKTVLVTINEPVLIKPVDFSRADEKANLCFADLAELLANIYMALAIQLILVQTEPLIKTELVHVHKALYTPKRSLKALKRLNFPFMRSLSSLHAFILGDGSTTNRLSIKPQAMSG